MSKIDIETISKHYYDELLNDEEIASIYKVDRSWISRLRRMNKLATLNKNTRFTIQQVIGKLNEQGYTFEERYKNKNSAFAFLVNGNNRVIVKGSFSVEKTNTIRVHLADIPAEDAFDFIIFYSALEHVFWVIPSNALDYDISSITLWLGENTKSMYDKYREAWYLLKDFQS